MFSLKFEIEKIFIVKHSWAVDFLVWKRVTAFFLKKSQSKHALVSKSSFNLRFF